MSDARAANRLCFRAYVDADEDACIALWLKAWTAAYPDIDFAARLDWWRARWRNELAPVAHIVVAEQARRMVGFVTVDPATHYLDQIVVDPKLWRSGVGAALIEHARAISPSGLALDVNTDNARAIAFYQKLGFTVTSSGKNPISGKPVHRMSWRP